MGYLRSTAIYIFTNYLVRTGPFWRALYTLLFWIKRIKNYKKISLWSAQIAKVRLQTKELETRNPFSSLHGKVFFHDFSILKLSQSWNLNKFFFIKNIFFLSKMCKALRIKLKVFLRYRDNINLRKINNLCSRFILH